MTRPIDPAIPGEFGATVSAFELEWCGAVGTLDYSGAQISHGLDCLKRLWPEEVERRCADSRGCANAAAMVELGLMPVNRSMDLATSYDGCVVANVAPRIQS